jgi:hypothetical protein
LVLLTTEISAPVSTKHLNLLVLTSSSPTVTVSSPELRCSSHRFIAICGQPFTSHDGQLTGCSTTLFCRFPDLTQPLFWGLLKSAESLPTPSLKRESLPLPRSLPILPLSVGLRRQSRATWPACPQIKLRIAFALAGENLLSSVHLLAACPSRLRTLHLKGGPLVAVEGDLFFAERIALFSFSSIAWDRRMDSPLLRTIV